MKERTAICVSEEVMDKARKLNEKIGIPISQQFERAWVKMYDSK